MFANQLKLKANQLFKEEKYNQAIQLPLKIIDDKNED